MTQRSAVLFAALCAAAATTSLTEAAAKPPAGIYRISGPSSVSAGCEPLHHRGYTVEPHVAADPRHPDRLYATWAQDRGVDAARSVVARSDDAGRTWTALSTASARAACDGGAPTRKGIADDWISVGPDGTVYHSVLSLDPSAGGALQLYVETSRDGGRHWMSTAVPTGLVPDKEVVVADPGRPGVAYVAWCDVGSGTSLPVRVAQTTDWGASWIPRGSIPLPDAGAQDTAVQLGVLSDESLLAVYAHYSSTTESEATIKAVRSADGGMSWSLPVDLSSGTVHQAAEADGDEDLVNPDNLALAVRGDRALAVWSDPGATWREPSHLRTAVFDLDTGWAPGPSLSGQRAMVLPSAAMDRHGRAAVSWYDFGADEAAGDGIMTATVMGAVLVPGSAPAPIALTDSFDLAATAGSNSAGTGAFVGDYVGLAATKHGFVAVLSLAGQYGVHGVTDIYAAMLR